MTLLLDDPPVQARAMQQLEFLKVPLSPAVQVRVAELVGDPRNRGQAAGILTSAWQEFPLARAELRKLIPRAKRDQSLTDDLDRLFKVLPLEPEAVADALLHLTRDAPDAPLAFREQEEVAR